MHELYSYIVPKRTIIHDLYSYTVPKIALLITSYTLQRPPPDVSSVQRPPTIRGPSISWYHKVEHPKNPTFQAL